MFSIVYWCQKERVGFTAPAGMEMELVVASCWSDTVAPSGAKAECVPECAPVVTLAQPGEPEEVNTPSVPPSKPSVRAALHTVAVAVGVSVATDVLVAVLVRVAVGGVPVAVGVGAPAVQDGNLKEPMRVFQLTCPVV